MSTGHSWRIVHIEDSPLQVTLVRAILEKAFKDDDFIYINESTLSGALKRLDDGCLDVVLVDLGLPDARGPEAVKAVRTVCPEAPVIVLTGEDSLDVGKKCVRAGADYYIQKSEVGSLPIAILFSIERYDLRREKKIVADRYESIVEESPDWIVRFTKTGVITFANKTMLRALQIDSTGIVGHNVKDFLNPGQCLSHDSTIEKLSPKRPHIDGNDYWICGRLIHWRKSGLFDKAGRLIEVQAIGKDVTVDWELMQRLRKDVAKIGAKVQEKTCLLLDNAEATLKRTLGTM